MTRQPKAIPAQVKDWNTLPDDARVDPETVAALFAISGRTLNRRIKSGSIPAPVHPSPRAFNVGAIRRALRG